MRFVSSSCYQESSVSFSSSKERFRLPERLEDPSKRPTPWSSLQRGREAGMLVTNRNKKHHPRMPQHYLMTLLFK